MKLWAILCLLFPALVFAHPEGAPLKVVTTLPVLKALALEIGGPQIQVESLTQADQDPHFIKAVPSLKQKISRADCFIEIGLSLEPWADQVVKSSLNPKIQMGAPGRIVAASGVATLDVPKQLSRTQGDIHPAGNPHVWLSPTRTLEMAKVIATGLGVIDPSHKGLYDQNAKQFAQKLSDAFFGASLVKQVGQADLLWRLHKGQRLTPFLKSKNLSLGGWLSEAQHIQYPIITYHNEFTYLAHDLSLKMDDRIEEKPGVSPSARYKNELIKKAKAHNRRHIVAATYYRGYQPMIASIAKAIDAQVIFMDADCRKDESYFAFVSRILKTLGEAKR